MISMGRRSSGSAPFHPAPAARRCRRQGLLIGLIGTMHGFVAYTLILCGLTLICGGIARADRVLLSPDGTVLSANGIRADFMISPYKQNGNLSWFQYSTPQGIELELQRTDVLPDPHARYGLDLQYPIFPDLGGYPGLSVGVRDLLGTGTEHKSLYAATAKSFALSDRQLHILRDFRVSAGLGTGRIGGLFIGMQTHLTLGATLYAEVYRRQPNFGISAPLMRHLDVRAYSLNGAIFYGLSFTLKH